MEYFFEFLLELILEGSIEVSKCKKLPKWVRYPLIILIILFFLFVIGSLVLAGVLALKENLLGGIFILAVGLFLLIMSGVKFKEVYLKKNKKWYSSRILMHVDKKFI